MTFALVLIVFIGETKYAHMYVYVVMSTWKRYIVQVSLSNSVIIQTCNVYNSRFHIKNNYLEYTKAAILINYNCILFPHVRGIYFDTSIFFRKPVIISVSEFNYLFYQQPT